MKLSIFPKTGEIPRLDAYSLPDGAAATAQNVSLTSGHVKGLKPRASSGLTPPPVVTGMYVHPKTGKWYTWNTAFQVDAVTGPIVDDQFARFYYLDGANLRVARGDTVNTDGHPPVANWVAGVPKPSSAATFEEYATTFPRGADTITLVPSCLPSLVSDAISYTVTTETAGQSYLLDLTGLPPCAGATVGDASTFYAVATGTDTISEYPTPLTIYALASSPDLSSATLYLPKSEFQKAFSSVNMSQLVLMVRVGSSETTYNRTFYKLSDGSYSTNNSATPPSTSSTEDVRSFVVNMTISNDGQFVGKLSLAVNEVVALPASVGGGAWSATLDKVSNTQYRVRVFPGNSGVASTETRVYTYTYVNIWGEEGTPADPATIEVTPGLDVTVNVFSASNGAYQSMDRIRLYRTNTGTDTTSYQFVKEAAKTSLNDWTTITDDVPSSQLGEVVSTIGYLPPPAGATAVEVMSNGVMALLKGNEVWFSEPFLPYAFNPANTLAMSNNGIGMVAYESSLLVTTTASPRIISGVSPEGMVEQILPDTQAGVSRNSIARIGNAVAYLSNDGIVVARGLDTTIGTSLQLFTRDEWRSRYASWLPYGHLAVQDGALVCAFGNPATQTHIDGFVLRLDESEGVFSRYTERAVAMATWDVNDTLYQALGSAIYAYGAGASTLAWVWESKKFRLATPHCFGVCQVHGSGRLTVTITALGDEVIEKTVTLAGLPATFRLPAGYVTDVWSIKVEGAAGSEFRWAHLATSPSELRDV